MVVQENSVDQTNPPLPKEVPSPEQLKQIENNMSAENISPLRPSKVDTAVKIFDASEARHTVESPVKIGDTVFQEISEKSPDPVSAEPVEDSSRFEMV